MRKNNLFRRSIRKILSPPSVGYSFVAYKNYQELRDLFNQNNIVLPRILFIGSGDKIGKGCEELGKMVIASSVKLDIIPRGSVNILGNAHNLPFLSEVFDGVCLQGVLQYLKNPLIAIEEIHRVLKKGGYVYVDAPFFHPYRSDETDYWRFTPLGIEQVFSKFQKIKSGITGGPTSSLLHVLLHYMVILFSFNSEFLWNVWFTIGRWLLFPFKYLDNIIGKSKFVKDIPVGVYFMGRKV